MTEKEGFVKSQTAFGKIHRVIAVMSGKGGVGKSLITALLAVSLRRQGFKTGVLDADVTGPSIPKLFGLKQKSGSQGKAILPVETENGIKVISINLMLENEEQPVIWRGPLISGVVKQFFEEVAWGDLDFLVVDLPPGTGDVPLTVMQSLPLDGVTIVTSPQELVAMIVKKAIHMAGQLQVPLLGMVENMSYLECPDCHRKIELFGTSNAEMVAQKFGIPLLGRLPVIPDIATLCDEGRMECIDEHIADFGAGIVEKIQKSL